MSQAFFDYIRNLSDQVPEGYTQDGMNLYRYLVYLGASQMIASCFPELKQKLSDDDWDWLINRFIQQSAWTSNFYGDLENEFAHFIRAQAQYME